MRPKEFKKGTAYDYMLKWPKSLRSAPRGLERIWAIFGIFLLTFLRGETFYD